MHEMTEFSHDLKKQFEGRDVVFLYISVGDAEAKWQKTLVDKQFTSANSVHLRSSGSEEAIAYQVNGYPSYYLIDREGRFVQAYTSRPSEGAKTVAAIEQALAR
jgi:cytochrome oxidase Cu insertion factor (SCO1/SenC/PrrC family)